MKKPTIEIISIVGEPIFKIGDLVRHKANKKHYVITRIYKNPFNISVSKSPYPQS